jgi:RNA polymerase sigma factor (sigma-70 family)
MCGTVARPLDAAAQEQVRRYCWLAYQLAWRFARNQARDMPADELIAEALYGLTYAAGLYQEERGLAFGAYARLVIRHRLTQCTMHWRRARRARSFPIVAGTEGPIEWEAEDCSGPDACADSAASEMCHRVRAVLSDRLYNVLCLRHAEGRTLTEIASRMGISRQRVRQLMMMARNQVRQCFPHWTSL